MPKANSPNINWPSILLINVLKGVVLNNDRGEIRIICNTEKVILFLKWSTFVHTHGYNYCQ